MNSWTLMHVLFLTPYTSTRYLLYVIRLMVGSCTKWCLWIFVYFKKMSSDCSFRLISISLNKKISYIILIYDSHCFILFYKCLIISCLYWYGLNQWTIKRYGYNQIGLLNRCSRPSFVAKVDKHPRTVVANSSNFPIIFIPCGSWTRKMSERM